MGDSYMVGKNEVVEWVKRSFEKGSTCLDVGCGSGIWGDLLGDYLKMDGVEVFFPYIKPLLDKGRYDVIFHFDIADLDYDHYDLVIFGDVIEHMEVDKAQAVLEYAKHHSDDHVVAVPWLYEQGELNGNVYETHLQPDLTPDVFEERYPGYSPLWMGPNYAYYHCK